MERPGLASWQHGRVATERTLYDRVGGMAFFERLVDHFYDEGVANDPVLLGLYPDPNDLRPAKERLRLFLVQYWGGPTTYSDVRGHPRLRMRHAPFAIGPLERDHWLAAMQAAVKSTGVKGMEFEALLSYFNPAAEAMRNRDEPHAGTGSNDA